MQNKTKKYYPTILEAVHLLVLYIFLQSLIDFPLALYDYHYDTNWLNNVWIGSLANFSITAFIFIFGYRKAHAPFKQVFAIKSFNPLILIAILFILPAMQYLVGFINIKILQILPAPTWFWDLFEQILDNHFGYWGSFAKLVIIAPIVEEVLFRGIIMHGLMRNYKSWLAILLSGILFSAFHLNPWQMSYTFFLGILLGWLVVRTRSLPLAILVHSLNNFIVLFSITQHNTVSELAISLMPQQKLILISTYSLAIGILLIVAITLKNKKQFDTFVKFEKKKNR
jgi:hypothetical protein